MKNIHLHIITALLVLVTLASCNTDRDEIVMIDVSEPPFIEVTGSIGGLVKDANGNPIPDVVVSFENNSAITDQNGVYFFDEIALNENGSNFQFRKNGYFNSYKSIKGRLNERTFTKTVMLDKAPFEIYDATSRFTIPVFETGLLTFPVGCIIDEDGIPFEGRVTVYLTEIDPFKNDQLVKTPGDFRGLSNGAFVQLASYGMIHLELETSDNVSLEINPEIPVNIEMPILGGEPPQEVATWYFDSNGKWIETDKATRVFENQVSNTFRAIIDRTGFWNCDASFPAVRMQGRFIYPNENPISNRLLKIEQNVGGLTNYGYTDQDGFFAGYVPANSNLLLSIVNEPELCGALHQMDFLTGDATLNLGEQVAESDIDNASNPQISMRLTGCDTLGLERAYVLLNSETANYTYVADQNGEITVQIPSCVGAFTLTALDHETGNFVIAYSSDQFTEDINLNDIQICPQNDAFFNYTVLGQDYSSPYCSVTTDGTVQFDNDPDSLSSIVLRLEFDPSELNTNDSFPISFLQIIPDASNQNIIYRCDGIDTCQVLLMFNQLDVENNFYIGRFDGTIPFDGEFIPVNGMFSTN